MLSGRSDLIAAFRQFRDEGAVAVDEARFVGLVQRRPVRTQSGVTPVTVLTRPHPCPGQCIFCPNDVRMPKSYLSDEPGAQRAANNRFDPYLQTWNRLAAFMRLLKGMDDLQRKIQLDALSMSLGISLVGCAAYSLLVTWGYIVDEEVTDIFMLMCVAYSISVLIGVWRYR